MFATSNTLPLIRVANEHQWSRLFEKYATVAMIQQMYNVSRRTAYRYAALMQRFLVFDEKRCMTFIVVPRQALRSFTKPKRGNPYWW